MEVKKKYVRKPNPMEKSRREDRVRIDDRTFLRMFIDCHGDPREMAGRTGMAIATIYARIRKCPRVKLVRDHFIGLMCEVAEDNLYSNVMQGDMAASLFVLRTRMKDKYNDKVAEDTSAEPVRSVTFIVKKDAIKHDTCNDSITD